MLKKEDKFPARLKKLRTQKGFTQEKMAKAFNMSTRGYQNYETGKSTPPYKLLLDLATFFDVSLDYLVGWSNVRNIKQK